MNKLDIYVETADKDPVKLGTIRLVGGKVVADSRTKDFVLPEVTEPDTLGTLTPKDGERYLNALAVEYNVNSSYISAEPS